MKQMNGGLIYENYLKDRFALTDKGAEGTIVAIKYSTLKNLSYMLPMFLLMYVMQGLLGLGKFNLKISVVLYIVIALIMIFVINKDYITTYNETYKESANLRIELSEIIKDLPLSFYSKRDLTDFSNDYEGCRGNGAWSFSCSFRFLWLYNKPSYYFHFVANWKCKAWSCSYSSNLYFCYFEFDFHQNPKEGDGDLLQRTEKVFEDVPRTNRSIH